MPDSTQANNQEWTILLFSTKPIKEVSLLELEVDREEEPQLKLSVLCNLQSVLVVDHLALFQVSKELFGKWLHKQTPMKWDMLSCANLLFVYAYWKN